MNKHHAALLFTPVYGMHGLLPSQGELYRDVMLMMDE
jgi:hypothetical protein